MHTMILPSGTQVRITTSEVENLASAYPTIERIVANDVQAKYRLSGILGNSVQVVVNVHSEAFDLLEYTINRWSREGSRV